MDIIVDDEFFHSAIVEIEKHISELKQVMDKITQMTVEATNMQMELVTIINAKSWDDIMQMIGLSSCDVNKLDEEMTNQPD